jgi:hypothetical protein
VGSTAACSPRLDRTGACPVGLPRPALVAEVPKSVSHGDQRVALPAACPTAARIPILEANRLVLPRQRVTCRLVTFDLLPPSSAALKSESASGDLPEDWRESDACLCAHPPRIYCNVKRLPTHPSRASHARERDALRTIVSASPQ